MHYFYDLGRSNFFFLWSKKIKWKKKEGGSKTKIVDLLPDYMSNDESSRYALRPREREVEEKSAKPRGKKGGRPSGPSSASKAKRRMQQLSEVAHSAEANEKRIKTRAANDERKMTQELARNYKAEHAIGTRPQIFYEERVVYVRPERKVVREAESRSIEHILNQFEQVWLRAWVRKEAVTKDGSKFTKEIIEAIWKQFGKKLSKATMRNVLFSMGIQWHQLYPGYFKEKAAEEYNVARRRLLVPVLHFLQSQKNVVLWVYDQCHAVVNDFVGMGWCDMTLPGAQYKAWIKKEGETGEWLTISAFMSETFGLLLDDNGRHVGRLAKLTSNANVVAEDFDVAAKLVNLRWPQYLHIFQTDSPNVHTQFVAGSCNPKVLNKSDGGPNRGEDKLFGRHGLQWIFEQYYGENGDDVRRQTVGELRDRLWDKPAVRDQLFRLEEVCQRYGSLLIFNCVGHPHLSAIEYLWRDIKYNYRVETRKTAAELKKHWELWLSDAIDAEWVASYFRSSKAFISYYLHGGTGKITERSARQGVEDDFEALCPDGVQAKMESMANLFRHVPGLRAAEPDQMRDLLQPYMHLLNIMRKRKVVERFFPE